MQSKGIFTLTILLLIFTGLSAGEERQERPGLKKTAILGVLDTMAINNIFLPYENDGSTADNARAFFPNGSNRSFLFQGGIAATGFVNGQLRASWMAKASLIQEFQPGTWEGRNNPDDGAFRFYTVTSADGPGSPAYVDWANAVALGADFQDVDGNGAYDPTIDRPDLLGDRTSWTVYSDGTGNDIRSDGLQTNPIGLEIHQTVWAFARADELGNVIFFRYRFINRAETDINDLIFSIWADPDIGDATDDLIGSDTTLSLGYIYNEGDDPVYGANPPAFGVDFFQGPIVDSPGDTAFVFRGPWFGVDTLPDRRNLELTSFVFYNNAGETDDFPSPRQNVQRARDYQLGGLNGHRVPINPAAIGVGGQATDPPQFLFSGEPEAQTGWRDTTPADKRFLVNTGPFQLRAWVDENGNGRPDIAEPGVQDIVVAYVVGQGNSPTNSVTELKRIDEIAQLAYNANFFVAGPPPPPVVTTRTFDNKIEFVIDLDANGTFDYDQVDKLLNRQVFEGVNIYQLNSPSINLRENDRLNRRLIHSFDLQNEYKDIYQRSGLLVERIYEGKNNINASAMADDGAAVLQFTVENDFFNQNQPLVNNTEYYFSITAFSINRGGDPPFLTDQGGGAWLGSSGVYLENNLGGAQLHRVVPGRDENRPFKSDVAKYTGPRPNHDGRVLVDVVDNSALTGDDYTVRFFENGSFYRILREADGVILRDSLAFQDSVGGNAWSFPITDGLSIKVQNVVNGLASAEVVGLGDSEVNWVKGSAAMSNATTSVYTNSIDLIQNSFRSNLSGGLKKSEYFPVELRFATTDNTTAHHYRGNYLISSGIKPTFLSAYDVRDPQNPRKLYVAYHNASPNGTIDFSSNNDIIVFNADYAETERYGRATTDTLFNKEAYLVMRFTADSTFQANDLTMRITPRYPNSDVDVFRIEGQAVSPVLTESQRQNQLERVNVVPNPYWAYSAYETSYDAPVIKFTHLPERVTIRIFNLAGQLIKTLEKNDPVNELSWNLRNDANLKIASGMYIAHVEAPGIGEKVLKFAVMQREERLDRF